MGIRTQDGNGGTAELRIFDNSRGAAMEHVDPEGLPLVYFEGQQPDIPRGYALSLLNDSMALPLRGDRFGGAASAAHLPIFLDTFEGGTINVTKWNSIVSTYTATQASAVGVLLNAASSTAANSGYLLRAYRLVTKTPRQPLHFRSRSRVAAQLNSIIEIGLGDATAFNGVHNAGAYWQVNAAGALQPIVTFGGVALVGPAASTLTATNYYTFDIVIDDDDVLFTIQDTQNGTFVYRNKIALPLTAPKHWSQTQLAPFARVYSTGVVLSAPPQLAIAEMLVTTLDTSLALTSDDVFASINRSAYENPFTGAQTPQLPPNAAAANATLLNGTASYATLGGLFAFASPAGALTDYTLFAYQCPANLLVSEVTIETWNTGAAGTTAPSLLVWSIATNLVNAAAHAAANGIRVPIGAQSLPVGAPIGSKAERVAHRFTTPLLCPAGRTIVVGLRLPSSNPTAAQVIQGMVTVGGKFV
jgi:hypothetical protein